MSEESSEPLAEPHEFRAQILAEYPDDFARFRDVLATLEHAIGSQESVQLSTELHRAMDMIMLQAYKSLCSVYVLVVRAHFEDAATICRRLMELAAQAGYIVEIEEDAEQNRRAGGYLASLWEAAPPQLKDALPADYRAAWEKYHRDHQHLLKGKWRTWRPSFKEIFSRLDKSDVYDEDYAFLSGVTHGSPPNLIFDYRGPVVQVRPHRHVPIMLKFSSRYGLAIMTLWNQLFAAIEVDRLDELVRANS